MLIELNSKDKIKIVNERIDFWNRIIDAKNNDMIELKKINHESKINYLLIYIQNTRNKIDILQQILYELTNQYK
jgi:hypothetical protein